MRILFLEDDDSVQTGVIFALKRAGYEVDPAGTIGEAKRTYTAHPPHLILTDVSLPDGSGLDFVRWVRQSSDVYIICLTAMDQETDQVMGYGAGADDYIVKPFSLSVLLLKLEAFSMRVEKKRRKVVISGDVRADFDEMKVYVDKAEVSLSKNEWRLLQLFLEEPKQILSKGQILEKLFDSDGNFVDENTVAVGISRLRSKIEPDKKCPSYIKNIRGLGYVWDRACTFL